MIEYRTGDLFEQDDVDAIGHGVNCVGLMGGGIAKLFRRKYPDMYSQYHRTCKRGALGGGDVFPWITDDNKVIMNMATQRNPGADAKIYLVIAALRRAIEVCHQYKVTSLALPRIGAGIGGLDWEGANGVKAAFHLVDEYSNPDIKIVVVTLPGEES